MRFSPCSRTRRGPAGASARRHAAGAGPTSRLTLYFPRSPRPRGDAAPPPRTLEETLVRHAPLHLSLALVAAAWAAAGCDRSPEAVIVPEFDLTYSFESGLEGWTTTTADLGAGSGTAAATSERSTQGTRSVRLDLANPGGAAKIWLTRELELTPGKSYTAQISFDLGTADHAAADAWKLILTARNTPPGSAAALDFQGDTSSGLATATGPQWVEKKFVVPVRPDEEGLLHLTVGIWGTTPGTRSYWLDNVRVVLTRTE